MTRIVTASGAMANMYRLPEDAGESIEIIEEEMLDDRRFKLVEPDPNVYVRVPSGTKARIRITGISELFEMTGQYGISKNIRMEFLIVKAGGSNQIQRELNGNRFTQLMTPKLGANSRLGALITGGTCFRLWAITSHLIQASCSPLTT